MKRIMVMVCMSMFLGMFLIPGGAMAYIEWELDWLKTTNQCPNCDLRGANLAGATLRGANLTLATLSGAYLSGAYLWQANLNGANLTDATWTDGSKCKEGSLGLCKKWPVYQREGDEKDSLSPFN